MISIPRPGMCCSTMTYERAVARPLASSTSMATFVVTCFVCGVQLRLHFPFVFPLPAARQ